MFCRVCKEEMEWSMDRLKYCCAECDEELTPQEIMDDFIANQELLIDLNRERL